MTKDRIKFWMSRVLEEKTNDIKIASTQISILNHQIEHFQGMNIIFKKKVLYDLLKDLKRYNATQSMDWSSACEEIQDEFDSLETED